MRKKFLALCALCLCGFFSAAAQTTVVTGTVTDANGIPYVGGQLTAQLVLAGAGVTGQPVVTVSNAQQCRSAGQGSAPCKIPFTATVGPVTLDSTGSFNLALQDNTLVTPAATQWTFNVTISPGVAPPFGTGPQRCTATLTITGASQSITSLAACPALSRSTSSTDALAIDLSAPPYSIKSAFTVPDATSVNTSNTITCPNSDCHFTTVGGTGAQVGWKVYGLCSTGIPLCPPVGTITAITNDNSIQVSNAATFSATAISVLVYGPDSTSALTAGTAAAWLLCPTGGSISILFPAGYFLTSLPQFNNPPVPCGANSATFNGTIGEQGGITFRGKGKFTSNIVPTPDFTFIGGSSNNGNFFSQMTGNISENIADMGINGLGWSCAGVTPNSFMINGALNTFITRSSFLDWCTKATGNFGGIRYGSGAGFLWVDTILDGVGTGSAGGVNIGGGCCNNLYGGWIDNVAGISLIVGGDVYTHNMQMGEGGTGNTVQLSSNSTWVSDGDNLGVGANALACVDARANGSTVIIQHGLFVCNGTTNFGIITSTNTTTVIMSDTSISGGTVSNGWLNGGAGATFIDKGGNTPSGIFAFTGHYIGATNSSRTTLCATGNFALTSGWGTSSVTSVAANGDIQGCHVTITGAAGSASPVLTWTYPQTPPITPNSCHLNGVSGTLTGVSLTTLGASSAAFTFTGTPSAQTYIFDVGCP